MGSSQNRSQKRSKPGLLATRVVITAVLRLSPDMLRECLPLSRMLCTLHGRQAIFTAWTKWTSSTRPARIACLSPGGLVV